MTDPGISARLANLLAVTDVRLSRMDVDDLLNEVLDRLRTILDADTAAVLLHEPGTDVLLARAACGLEEEVRQGVRVPIGAGLAGRIAAQRRTVRLDQVDQTTVANPILWEKGIQRMVGVPLLSGETLLGVLHVGRLAPRQFDRADEQLLQVAADRIAAAVQSRQYMVEASAAAQLERSLMPPRLPNVPGLRLATRYAPAEHRAIGGDWYDAFELPDGAFWIVTGDVAGHGLNAAVVMGRIKSVLRAYALLGETPARVLEMTDDKVWHFEMGAMVTVICARAAPPFEDWLVSSAGHPPPVLAAPGTGTTLADVPPGPPLGAIPGARRHDVHVTVPPGGLLIFYTDGLVERRDEALDDGLERLRRVVTARDPEWVCQTVMHELVGGGTPTDDIALAAVRRSSRSTDDPDGADAGNHRVREWAADPQSPAAARRFAAEVAGPLPPDVQENLELLVSEVASNAVLHGGTPFRIAVTRHVSSVLVEVSDTGGGRIAARHPDPADPHGRGLSIVARVADDWGIRTSAARPERTVWFRLSVAGASAALDRHRVGALDSAT